VSKTTTTLSETSSKKGRPRLLTGEALHFLKAQYPEIKTTRGLQNKRYELRAFGLLRDAPPPGFDYLFDLERDHIRSSVLAELGRIEDDEQLLDTAAWLCKQRPSTKDAIVICRRVRGLGETNALATTIKVLRILEDDSKFADDPDRFVAAVMQNVAGVIGGQP